MTSLPSSLDDLVFRDSPVAMAIADADGRMVQVNAALCALLHARADELIGADLAALLPVPVRWDGDADRHDAARDRGAHTGIRSIDRGDGTTGRFLVSTHALTVGADAPLTVCWLSELPAAATIADGSGGAEGRDGRKGEAGTGFLSLDTLLRCLPLPVLILDAERRIVSVSPDLEQDGLLAPGLARRGAPLRALGEAEWRALDDDVAMLLLHGGQARHTLDLTMADGRRAPTHVDATVVTTEDGARRVVLALQPLNRLSVDRQRQVDEHRRRARRDAYQQASDGLVGLATLWQLDAPPGDALRRARLDAAAQVMALSTVYVWQGRTPGYLPLRSILRAVVGHRARVHGLSIPLAPSSPDDGVTSMQPILRERDALPVVLAIDELVANAITHRSPDGAVSARLLAAPRCIEMEVRNDGRLRAPLDVDALEAGTSGLGLLKTLLPADAHLSVREADGQVVATLRLTAPLVRYR